MLFVVDRIVGANVVLEVAVGGLVDLMKCVIMGALICSSVVLNSFRNVMIPPF